MEGVASLVSIAALAAAWWFIASRLKNRNWFLRHFVGSSVGVFTMLVVVMLFIASGVVDPESSSADADQADLKASATPPYTIVSDDYHRGLKRTVLVALDARITEPELAAIAEDIKSQAKRETARTFISYRVEGNTTGVYWATTHFDPDLEVRIIGMTASEAEKAKEHKPSQFASVREMMAAFNDYSEETGQFQIVSEQPLHIHLRPGIVDGEPESAVHEQLKRAVVYGIYKSMVHTPADQVRVTASPMIVTYQPFTQTPADSPVYDIALTRQQALAAVATFFPVEDLQELVTLQGTGGITYEAWAPAFEALYYESHRPGLNAFFEAIEKKSLR